MLGVAEGADFNLITQAYKNMSKKYHPDKVAHLGEEFSRVSEEKMKQVNEAYQYFKDKKELVSEATRLHLAKEQKDFEDISQNAANAIDELFEVSKCVRQSINDLNPAVLFDLKRFYPISYNHWLEFKEEHVFKSIINNLDKGIADGHFRKDLNAGILANLRLWEIQSLFDTESFPRDKFDFREVQMQLFDHFVFGIVKEK